MQQDFNDSLTNMAAQLGTPRDKAAHNTFASTIGFGPDQAEISYRNEWLARAIIDKRADDSTRKWREIHGVDDAAVTRIEALEKRHQIKDKVNRALKLAGIHGGSAIYFDTGDSPDEPLPDTPRDLQFCTVFTRQDLNPGEIENDPMEAGYGRPKYYTISFGPNQEQRRIHPSRLAIFVGERTDGLTLAADNQGWGDSRLRPVFDAIKQFLSTTANINSLIFEAKVDVFGISGLTSLVMEDGGAGRLANRYGVLAAMKGNNGMIVLDKDNESYDQKSASFASLPELIDRFEQVVSGAAGMPRALLFGTASGGLGANGELELSSYYDSVSAEQENDISPAMEGLDRVLLATAGAPQAWFTWRSLWQMSDKERAELAHKQADTIRILNETGLFDAQSLQEAAINMFAESGVLALTAGVEEDVLVP